MNGYTFCSTTGLCLENDPACTAYLANGICSQCLSNYQLYQGKCLQLPPGVITLPTGGSSCSSGYIQSNNSCLRDPATLTTASSNPN